MTVAVPVSRRPIVLADLLPGSAVRDAALVVGGAAFVGLTAQLSIYLPGTPVPVTGQTFGVLLVGAALGWRRSFAAMALYLLAGMVGLPWFASHGSGYHFASFGYILSYLVAAPLVGALARRGGDRTPIRTVLTMALGNALIYLIGVTYLAADLHLSGGTAIHEGMRPFLVGDTVKMALAAGLLPTTWALVNRTRD